MKVDLIFFAVVASTSLDDIVDFLLILPLGVGDLLFVLELFLGLLSETGALFPVGFLALNNEVT